MTGTDSGFLNIYQLYSPQGEKGKQKAKKMYMIKGTNKEKREILIPDNGKMMAHLGLQHPQYQSTYCKS